MRLTKIKRRDLRAGDMFVIDNKPDTSEIYFAIHDGIVIPINVVNEIVYRITKFSYENYTNELEKRCRNQRESISGFIIRINELVDGINERDAEIQCLKGKKHQPILY